MNPSQVLHGDLHLDNVLSQGKGWVSVDPKGVMGEVEFEVASFDFIHDHEVFSPELLEDRIELFSTMGGFSAKRVLDWVFLRYTLSALWSIEDQGDPKRALQRALSLL